MSRQKRKQTKVVLKPGQQEFILYNGYKVKLTGTRGHYNPEFHPNHPSNRPPNHFYQYFAKEENWQCLNCGQWLFRGVRPVGADGIRPPNPPIPPCPEPMI